MSFITTQFQAILLSGFLGVAPTNSFSSIFHFGKISKFKKGIIPRKKNRIKISYWYAHLHIIMSFKTTKFQAILLRVLEELRWQTISVVSFILVKFLSSKRHYSEKKNESKFSVDIMFFITTKFYEILLSCFWGVALTRKTRQSDWQTWRTRQKHYTLRN